MGLRNKFFCPKNAFPLFHIAMNIEHPVYQKELIYTIDIGVMAKDGQIIPFKLI